MYVVHVTGAPLLDYSIRLYWGAWLWWIGGYVCACSLYLYRRLVSCRVFSASDAALARARWFCCCTPCVNRINPAQGIAGNAVRVRGGGTHVETGDREWSVLCCFEIGCLGQPTFHVRPFPVVVAPTPSIGMSSVF